MTTTESTRTGYSTFGRAFWRATIDRALKTAAQALIGVWGLGDGVFDILQVDVKGAIGLAVGGFVLSVLTSIVSAPIGPVDSPSMI
jgi:r1t holin